jgi:hypothetical protein
MVNRIRFTCESKIMMIPVSHILPVKKLSPGINKTAKYCRIAASVREVGIVEPLVVYPQENGTTQYILLDGHIRLEILKEIGQDKANCLVAVDKTRLPFTVSALKQLFHDDFVNLLRAELLDSLPQYLAAQIHGEAC